MIRKLILLGLVFVVLGGMAGAVLDGGPSAAVPVTSTDAEALEASPTAEAPPPAPAAPAPVTNRGDCNAIRGTAYLSQEERGWYLANCVTR